MQEDWLVTGFPGFRARALVRRALETRPDLHLSLLVDRERRTAAERELEDIGLPRAARAELILGETGHIDFGLTGARYLELAGRITRIHHLYQALGPSLEAKVARSVNVGGAREILEFARVAKKLEHLVHYSSVFVSGDRVGVVLEDELEAGQGFRSESEASLALGEAMLKRAEDLPLTVIRAAQIVGDSRTGEADRLDGPYPLIAFVVGSSGEDVAFALPAKADARLTMLPVDFLAAAGIAFGESQAAVGQTLHLAAAGSVSARELVERVAELCDKRVVWGLGPAPLTRTLMRNPGSRLLARHFRALQDWLTTSVRYDDTRADALLFSVGLERPELSEFLPSMIEHVRARVKAGAFDPPDAQEASAVVA
jgi:thioester reductase-like protein